MEVRVVEEATKEMIAAASYYDRQSAGLGSKFLDAIDQAVDWLRERPMIGRTIDETFRQFSLTLFPYSVIYHVEDNTVLIVAIAHHRRLPGYWATSKSGE